MRQDANRRWPGALGICAVAAMLAPVLGAAAPAPQNPQNNPIAGFSNNRNEPMHIEALKLEVRDKDKVATFTGNVQVIQGDTTLKCKVLVVYYDQQSAPGAAKTAKSTTPGPAGSQQIRRLEAKGDVIVTQKDQIATGDNGTFDVKSNTVTLSGNVVVNQGPNVTRGERVVVDLTSGVTHVDAGTGPVRMLIQQKPGKDPSPASKMVPGRLFSN